MNSLAYAVHMLVTGNKTAHCSNSITLSQIEEESLAELRLLSQSHLVDPALAFGDGQELREWWVTGVVEHQDESASTG